VLRVVGEEDGINDFDVTLEDVQDTEQLKEVLEQFGITEGIIYRIYRSTPSGPSFCYETAEYSETFLQRERGAGAYVVRIYIDAKYKKSIPVQVDAPASGPGTAENQTGSHSAFLEKMLMALILKDHQPAPAGPSITDLTTALSNLDALRGKQESGIDLFMKAFTLAKDLQGDKDNSSGDWKTELLKMGRDAIPAITSVVQARTQPNPPPTQVQEPPVIDPNQLTEEQRKGMLRQAITYLKSQFISGLPPESALDFIVANSGNPQYQAIITAVLSYRFEDILELDHEIKSEPFHLCFRTLYDGLRSEFGGEDTVENDPRGDTGDVANAGNDGDSVKTRQ
jgi:hypothetical protein